VACAGQQWLHRRPSPVPQAQKAGASASQREAGVIGAPPQHTFFKESSDYARSECPGLRAQVSAKHGAHRRFEGAIAGVTRRAVLRPAPRWRSGNYPALLLRIDSPAARWATARRIHAPAVLAPSAKGLSAWWPDFRQYFRLGGVYRGRGGRVRSGQLPGTITGSNRVILRGTTSRGCWSGSDPFGNRSKSGPTTKILSPGSRPHRGGAPAAPRR